MKETLHQDIQEGEFGTGNPDPVDASMRQELSYEEKEVSEESEEQIMVKLKALRRLLFREIMGNGNPETEDEPSLKIPPRTLSEAVKALIDIDKRISEHEGTRQTSMSDIYQSILAKCAKDIECESK